MIILDFFEYIYDRQAMKKRKERFPDNPEAWTKDPILKQYRFCNVRRYDDAGTQHLVKEVLQRKSLTPDDVLFNIIMYRFFNVRNLYTEIMGFVPNVRRFNFKYIEEILDDAKKEGLKLFSTAYMICGLPHIKYRKEDKHVQVLARMKDISIDPRFYKLKDYVYAEGFMEAIKFEGDYLIGDFLAYQMMLDWSYYQKLYGMEDMDYCGPGTIWTLNQLFKNEPQFDTPESGLRRLTDIQNDSFNVLRRQKRKNWLDVCGVDPNISITDLENCLCEFRKYTQLKNGTKGKKRYYELSTTSKTS